MDDDQRGAGRGRAIQVRAMWVSRGARTCWGRGCSCSAIPPPAPTRPFRWAFDLDVAHDLFDDYCVQDYVPFLRHEVMAGAESAPPVTLVRAARNAHWSQQRLRELHPQLNEVEEDQRVGAFRVVRLPDAGHWVHIDNPAGLADLMLPSLALD